MLKQEEVNKKMSKDYQMIREGLLKNHDRIQKIAQYLNNESLESRNNMSELVLDNLRFLVQSFDYLDLSCKKVKSDGSGNDFLPYTRFYRDFICTTKITCYSVKKYFSPDLIDILNNVFNWRNEIEHAKDPYYEGKLNEIMNNLSIDKMAIIIEEIYRIATENYSKISETVSYFCIEYSKVPIDIRKQIISEMEPLQKSIFAKIIRLSHKAMEKPLSSDDKIVFDIGIKINDLCNCLKYTYSNTHRIIKDYSGLSGNDFQYFTRSSITSIYQIYDKLGFYLNDRYGLKLNRTYFKSVVKDIDNPKIKDGALANKIITLSKSCEYIQLSKIRNTFVHEKKSKKAIDYVTDSEILSSLIVKNVKELLIVINMINEDHFIQKGYKVETSDNYELERLWKVEEL